MGFRNYFGNSLFLKSIRLARSNPGKVGVMVLLDIMFVVSFFILQKLSVYLGGSIFSYQSVPVLAFLAVSLAYYLALLFLYTIFKYSMLGLVKSLFGKAKSSSGRFGMFYLLNMSIAAIFFAIMLALNFLLFSVKQPYARLVFIFLAVPYLLVLYIVLNLSHCIFYEGATIKNTLKSSFRITFSKLGAYRELILAMIVFALLSWALLSGGGYLAGLLASKSNVSYLNVYGIFRQASIITIDVLLYFIILLNRISFNSAARESK